MCFLRKFPNPEFRRSVFIIHYQWMKSFMVLGDVHVHNLQAL